MSNFVSTETYTYTTFGGCDIRAMFGSEVIINLQGVSYSITREKAPQYVMGRTDPVSISRGKRGIAGSLIFMDMDKQALHEYMSGKAYFRKDGDIYIPDVVNGDLTGMNIANGEIAVPNYPDQIPPFDVTLTAINESSQAMAMRIFGVEIISNGSGVSVDDLNIEEQMTFICRGVSGWRPVMPNTDNMTLG